MVLTESARILLRECAVVMAQGTEKKLDSSRALMYILHRNSTIVAFLADEVEKASGHTRTVRPCDPALFEGPATMAQCLYLVVCNVSIPQGLVTDLCDDMVLYNLGAHKDGLRISGRAPRSAVEEAHAFADGARRQKTQREHAKQEIERILAATLALLRVRIADCHEPVQRSDAEEAMQNTTSGHVTLQQLAETAAALHVPLKDILMQALAV